MSQSLAQNRPRALIQMATGSGKTFTPQQRWWLDHVAGHIGVNLVITPRDLDGGDFFRRGGRFAALRELRLEWQELLEEMNKVLAVP